MRLVGYSYRKYEMRTTNEKKTSLQRGGSGALPSAHDRDASNQAGHHCPPADAQKVSEVPVKGYCRSRRIIATIGLR